MSSEARDVEVMTAGLRAGRAIGRAASVVSASTNASVYRIADAQRRSSGLMLLPFCGRGASTHEHQPPVLAS
jgi:hypothetical protein